MTNYSELLNQRRSIRNFENKDVPTEIIKEIIKESCLAPSSANEQPWRFVIINNQNMIKRISDECRQNLIARIEKDPDTGMKKYERALRNPDFNIFYNAPCLILIVGHRDIGSLYVDCALAAGYFMFSATHRGLGTCWIGFGVNIKDPELLELIGISRDHKIVAPLILGYPKRIPNPPRRLEPQILKVIS